MRKTAAFAKMDKKRKKEKIRINMKKTQLNKVQSKIFQCNVPQTFVSFRS